MKKFFYLSVFCVLALGACTGAFTKTKDGIEYKIISKGEGKTVGYGNYIQMHIEQSYNDGKKDSLISDTRTSPQGPAFEVLDSANMPPAYFKILSQLKKLENLPSQIGTYPILKSLN